MNRPPSTQCSGLEAAQFICKKKIKNDTIRIPISVCLGYQCYYLIYYKRKYYNITVDRADFFMLCGQKTKMKPDQSDGEGFVFFYPWLKSKKTHTYRKQ